MSTTFPRIRFRWVNALHGICHHHPSGLSSSKIYFIHQPSRIIFIFLIPSGNILSVWIFNKKDVELKPSFANLLKCLSVFDTIFLVRGLWSMLRQRETNELETVCGLMNSSAPNTTLITSPLTRVLIRDYPQNYIKVKKFDKDCLTSWRNSILKYLKFNISIWNFCLRKSQRKCLFMSIKVWIWISVLRLVTVTYQYWWAPDMTIASYWVWGRDK